MGVAANAYPPYALLCELRFCFEACSVKTGYTKAWRKELKSDIWKMPPLYHRVWFYLRQKANWETRLLPTRQIPKMGMWISPGMLVTSYQILAEGVSYYSDGRLKVPNKRTIMVILEWLEEYSMITRISNGLGTVIFINNWDIYQGELYEEVTGEAPPKAPPKAPPNAHYEEVKRIQKNSKETPTSSRRTKTGLIDSYKNRPLWQDTPPSWLPDLQAVYPADRWDEPQALKAIAENGVTAEDGLKIISFVTRKKDSEEWKKNDGQYVPSVGKLIQSQKWKTQPQTKEDEYARRAKLLASNRKN